MMKKFFLTFVVISFLLEFSGCQLLEHLFMPDIIDSIKIGSVTVNPVVITENGSAIITLTLINPYRRMIVIKSVPSIGVTNPSRAETNGSTVSIEYISAELPDGIIEQTILVKIVAIDTENGEVDRTEVRIIVKKNRILLFE